MTSLLSLVKAALVRMPGLNYRLGRLPLIPPKGIVLEAIDPQEYAKGQVLRNAQYLKKKETG